MASTIRTVAAETQVTGVLDMRMNFVKNLETDLAVYPTEPDHGASKKYVDSVRDEIVAQLPDLVDNGSF
jgi:hypothetical protein